LSSALFPPPALCLLWGLPLNLGCLRFWSLQLYPFSPFGLAGSLPGDIDRMDFPMGSCGRLGISESSIYVYNLLRVFPCPWFSSFLAPLCREVRCPQFFLKSVVSQRLGSLCPLAPLLAKISFKGLNPSFCGFGPVPLRKFYKVSGQNVPVALFTSPCPPLLHQPPRADVFPLETERGCPL